MQGLLANPMIGKMIFDHHGELPMCKQHLAVAHQAIFIGEATMRESKKVLQKP